MSRADEPAHPTTYDEVSNGRHGLTIREHFAGLAMQGVLAGNPVMRDEKWAQANAVLAVGLADALISELAKVQP